MARIRVTLQNGTTWEIDSTSLQDEIGWYKPPFLPKPISFRMIRQGTVHLFDFEDVASLTWLP